MFFFKTIKRKDQFVMYIHHIITVILLKASCNNDLTKILGTYVLFTHNLCDIPLNIYMLIDNHINYNNSKLIETKNIFKYCKNLMAILSIIFFGYLRIFMFGSLNLYMYIFNDTVSLFSNFMLLLLYSLNIYWFYLMIKGIINEIYNKKYNLYE